MKIIFSCFIFRAKLYVEGGMYVCDINKKQKHSYLLISFTSQNQFSRWLSFLNNFFPSRFYFSYFDI